MSEKETAMLKAFFQHHIRCNGILPPNSPELDRKIARLLLTPPFRELGVTVREFRDMYVKISGEILVPQ
jgi:hypothetical protein